jgi:TM2 domain-containing membrane protein YozV
MKILMIQKLRLTFTAMAIFLASCGSNATITKRYHNRGWSISWGGGSSSDVKNQKSSIKQVKNRHSEMIAKETTVEAVQEFKEPANIEAGAANVDVVKAVVPQKMKPLKSSRVSGTSFAAVKLAPIFKSKLPNQVVVQKKQSKGDPRDGKSLFLTLLLCFCLGTFGIHRFYLGYTTIGWIQFIIGIVCWNISSLEWILGLLAIWVLIDFFRILTYNLEPKNSYYRDGELFDR